ncbi:MAG: PAC2 family protein, partial [Actinomycetota bacterium]|nr:PAC2 family protein [Actinomycetota bacterium]
ALLADVPHSRAVHITATAANTALVDRLGLQRSRYEGPTGIVGVLSSAFAQAGIDAASLWAAVPHYLAVAPNPKAALALVERASELIGTGVDTSDLVDATETYEERVTEMVAADEDVQNYVRMLEERSDERDDDSEAPIDPSELPSGEEMAAELERYLREQGEAES